MKKFWKGLSMESQERRQRLIAAFALMTIIPLLICGWLVSNYVFPAYETIWDICLVILLTIVVAVLGLWLAKS